MSRALTRPVERLQARPALRQQPPQTRIVRKMVGGEARDGGARRSLPAIKFGQAAQEGKLVGRVSYADLVAHGLGLDQPEPGLSAC